VCFGYRSGSWVQGARQACCQCQILSTQASKSSSKWEEVLHRVSNLEKPPKQGTHGDCAVAGRWVELREDVPLGLCTWVLVRMGVYVCVICAHAPVRL
jgi:hypothetical protein